MATKILAVVAWTVLVVAIATPKKEEKPPPVKPVEFDFTKEAIAKFV